MSKILETNEVGTNIAGKYLTFALAGEEYGLEILKVREIVGYQQITKVPKTTHEIKGVINLRGQVIPIMDLRGRFGMEEKDVDDQTCIIVVENEREGRITPTGIIVDQVSEVLDIQIEQIEPPPQFGGSSMIDFIRGMGKIGGKVKILLDIDKVLSGADVSGWADMAMEMGNE
ncbi:MAG: purine-binding chemotaxis protein CheW [Pontiellaceae bacterium]|nr:purine-binding chemotaxis protein CheW [Pontiellaceae bacterium]MBN2785800.1 purine-binding chemotaxis protein CheW [Pontiellaceae bacterium]